MTVNRSFKNFYDQVGEHYPEEEEVYGTLRGILRKNFIAAFLSQVQGSLLDIGCNRGMYLQMYHNGPRYGLDLSLPVLRRARRHPSLHYVAADAERLYCFKNESFDVILCSEVVEHCLYPKQIFAGMARVLKSGGKALVTTPNYTRNRPQWIALGTLEHFGIKSVKNGKYFHSAFRPEELHRMASEAGLDVVESGTLEKEIKYAAKIPAVIYILCRFFNRFIHSHKLYDWNEHFFNSLTLYIYRICRFTRVEKMLLLFVKQGVRTYITMVKK
jgi:2-polyprenyl-3-methyl-5-hydroxy-6-metoxy-1,4-benzoquinol methylase